MSWIIYRRERPANELWWLRTAAELIVRVEDEEDKMTADIVDAEMEAAFDSAKEAGWNGEMDEEPHVFVLPALDVFRFGFVWTCPDPERPLIVASPLPLPWLED